MVIPGVCRCDEIYVREGVSVLRHPLLRIVEFESGKILYFEAINVSSGNKHVLIHYRV